MQNTNDGNLKRQIFHIVLSGVVAVCIAILQKIAVSIGADAPACTAVADIHTAGMLGMAVRAALMPFVDVG
jgi:hypothetical protein